MTPCGHKHAFTVFDIREFDIGIDVAGVLLDALSVVLALGFEGSVGRRGSRLAIQYKVRDWQGNCTECQNTGQEMNASQWLPTVRV